MNKSSWTRTLLALACTVLLPACAVALSRTGSRGAERYPYGGAEFTRFVDESYQVNKAGSGERFYRWFESAYKSSKLRYPGKEDLELRPLLRWQKSRLAEIKTVPQKTQAEIALGKWLHKLVKGTIPRFSLDRGFEFCNTEACGERQCFLQSVLIAGLLQETGVDAGVVMVYQNIAGQSSNNGHAVTLVKLPDGRDIVVDASEPMPFPTHRGLFVRCSGYRYMHPVYDRSAVIVRYNLASGGSLSPAKVRTLGRAFLRSQFYYYRGERAPGGLLAARRTAKGMQASVRFLRESVRICPENPLAVYMLARALRSTGDQAGAQSCAVKAAGLYGRYGWTPGGMGDLIKTKG